MLNLYMSEIDEILERARETLKTAKMGLSLLKGPDENLKPLGFQNVVIFGRSVTFVLQNLKSKTPLFDEWYEPYQIEMRNDSLLSSFKDIRNSIEKEGDDKVTSQVYIQSFSTEELSKYPKPPGARSFFMGDKYGRSGWEVELPDGTIERIFVNISNLNVYTRSVIRKIPKTHLGSEIKNPSIDHLSELYLNYLEKMVSDAERTFSSK